MKTTRPAVLWVAAVIFVFALRCGSQAQPQKVVEVVAAGQAQGLFQPIAEKTIPVVTNFFVGEYGTFWSLQHIMNGSPRPPLPYRRFPELNVYEVDATNRIYLIDDRSVDYEGLHDLLETESFLMAMFFEMEGEGESMFCMSYTSSDLWLEIVSKTNTTAFFIVHPPESEEGIGVYDLYSTTNLSASVPGLNATNWQWVLRTEPGQTNVTVIELSDDTRFFRLGRTNDHDEDGMSTAFENLVSHSDWNDADQNTNGILDGWEWHHFGDLNQTAEGDYDNDGISNGLEYTNHTDPNTIRFWLTSPTYVNTSSWARVNIRGGVPAHRAVVIDGTNLSSATWSAYDSNILVNLGSNEGWHKVWVGVRGRSAASQQTWHSKRVKMDLTPPSLVITNPSQPTVSQPAIQLQGYCPEPLKSFRYDLTNSAGLVTNRLVLITEVSYSTNTWEICTNYFQAFDVELVDGLNTITLYAVDLAGNETTTNVSFTFDYSNDTNPPAIKLNWPQNETRTSGTNFTWRGQLDDFTASLRAFLVDTNGTTNAFSGIVERNGNFWLENLPLRSGTNLFTLTATDHAGNMSITNVSVIYGGALLTINPISLGASNVSGTISAANYAIWVNGTKAINYGDGTWWAFEVQVGPSVGGPIVVQARAIPESDNGGNGSGGTPTGSNFGSSDNNPKSTGAVDKEQDIEAPSGIFLDSYDYNVNWRISNMPTNTPEVADKTVETFNWNNGKGGTRKEKEEWLEEGWWKTEDSVWGPIWWPQEVNRLGVLDIVNQSGPYSTTTVDSPALVQEHFIAEVNYPTFGGDNIPADVSRYADAVMKLVTGGPKGSKEENLWEISATVEEIINPEDVLLGYEPIKIPVAPERIAIGNLGNLNAEGFLYAVLPDGDPEVTPHVIDVDRATWVIHGKKRLLKTECEATTPGDRSRKILGVGEVVQVSFVPALERPPYPRWSSDPGSVINKTGGAGFGGPQYGTTMEFTAPSNKANAIIRIAFPAVTIQRKFEVIEPKEIHRADLISLRSYDIGAAGAGMNLRPFVGPTNVSFYRIEVMEVGEDASPVEGYFTNFSASFLSHIGHGADVWVKPISYGNAWANGDIAASTTYLPYSPGGWLGGGSFKWNIPGKWKIGSGQTNDFEKGWDQLFEMDANGTMKVTKFGWTVTRQINQTFGNATFGNAP